MKYPIIASIFAGIAIGFALFAFPLTIAVVGTVVTIGFLFRLIRGPRWYHHHYAMHTAWAGAEFDKEAFDKMSPEEKMDFRRRMYMNRCSHYTGFSDMKKEEKA